MQQQDDKDGVDLTGAYARLQQHIAKNWAAQALFDKPLTMSGKPKWHRTGRAARRAARRGYMMEKPQRSRCQRSAEKRGVRRVYGSAR